MDDVLRYANENLKEAHSQEHVVRLIGYPLKKDNQTQDRGAKPQLLKIIHGSANMFYTKGHTMRKLKARLQMQYPHLVIESSGMIKLENPKNAELQHKMRLRTVRRMVTQTGNKLIKYEKGVIDEFKTDIFGSDQVIKYLSEEKYIHYQRKHINYIKELIELESTTIHT